MQEKKIQNRISLRFKIIRKKMRITQHDMAIILGINQSSISKIENGQRDITVEEVALLLRKFDYRIILFLLTGEEHNPDFSQDYSSQPPLAQELEEWWQEEGYNNNPERIGWFKCQILDTFPTFADWIKKRRSVETVTA